MSEIPDLRESKFGMYRIVSIAILIVVIIATTLLFYRVMIGFFVPLFLAALLVVLFHPLHAYFGQRLKHRAKLAALLTTTTILLIVLLPGCVLLGVASIQATHLFKDLNLGSIDIAFSRALIASGLELPMAEELEAIDESLASLNQALSPTSSDIRIVRLERRFKELQQRLHEKKGNQYDAFFEQLQIDMQAIRDHAKKMEAADTTENELGLEDSPTNLFHQNVSSVTRDYRQLKNNISGGPILGPLRQTINPTPIKRERWIRQAVEYSQPFAVQLTQATAIFAGKTLFGLAILTISIYFFLIDGPGMTKTIMSLSPLDDRYERELLNEFEKVSRAVVLATFLSALAQGILAMIGYYFAGLQSIALLFLLTTFMALIPFLGAASVWLPCSLWLGLVQNNWTAAVLLAGYGTLVVSMADNVIKPLVLKGQSNLHPLLALLSVIGGVQVFGPIGILVGPMIVVFLQTLLEILNRELSHFDGHDLAKGDDDVEPSKTLPAAD